MLGSIPLFKAYHDEEMERNSLEVLRSGSIAVGKYNDLFTKSFGALVGHSGIVGTNDMSNAIQIALRLAGVEAGDEVLTTPYACMSTNSPISMVGAKPVWVDVHPDSATVDLESLGKACTPNCKAMILYHVCGYPGPVEEIARFCDERGIALIEDCDNALLATMNGRQVGTFSRFSIYSFYPNRQINASEGGALGCRDEADRARAVKLRRYGIDFSKFRTSDGEIDPNCDIPEIGWAATLNNLCSALGYAQITGVRARIEKAKVNAAEYDRLLEHSSIVRPLRLLPGSNPSYWTYLIRTKRSTELLSYLKGKGIGCSRVHVLNTPYSGFNAVSRELPGSEELMRSIIALPCGWWLESVDVAEITRLIEEF
ncbi:MAG: hypothetical protein A2Z96_07990 [Spirochaetes bacterium GWB1_48_6]|nr:MAG: hypothetical protein A2Z96_07990 [Spirochaetes bacterium GWB1_48_6]